MTPAYGSGGPPGAGALVDAVVWLQSLLLGTVATAIAVIAVAAIGLLMLNGRIDVRRAVTVIFGCFLLFGAPTIAAGLRGLAAMRDPVTAVPVSDSSIPAPVAVASPRPSPTSYDPYAGASVLH